MANMAFKASHSLFNYSNLIFLEHGVLPNKELLVLMYEPVEENIESKRGNCKKTDERPN